MDYSKTIEDLKLASLFDLYRLSIAIDQQLNDPQRIDEIKSRLKSGQIMRYFDPTENRLIEAQVIKFKRTQLLVKNLHNQQEWIIPFYWVDLDEINTDIVASSSLGLDKKQLKVGDIVGFHDKQNQDVHGEVIRLNQKTATVRTNTNTEWRVGYRWLYPVIDGEPRFPQIIEGKVIGE